MPKLSYLKALNRALAEEMERDESVFVLGEDMNFALTNVFAGFRDRFGPERVLEMPLSEQGFTNFATGAAMAGRRPVVEFQIPFLLLLVFEQITNQANKFRLMSGGQTSIPVTYLMPAAGARTAWGAQHSDQPYSLFALHGREDGDAGDADRCVRPAAHRDPGRRPGGVLRPAGLHGHA